uniref:Uncharacterized protein n=1 Tax=Glossina austeni TaxID=7395 RepID=A0A1A9V1L7_GLOAU
MIINISAKFYSDLDRGKLKFVCISRTEMADALVTYVIYYYHAFFASKEVVVVVVVLCLLLALIVVIVSYVTFILTNMQDIRDDKPYKRDPSTLSSIVLKQSSQFSRCLTRCVPCGGGGILLGQGRDQLAMARQHIYSLQPWNQQHFRK